MASKIELSRGNLLGKQKEGFGSAELFWEAKSNGKDSAFTKWNEGTLWIGRPEVDGPHGEKSERIPIAGGRIHNSLVFRGELSNERNRLDKRFEHARVGDFFIWSQRAAHTLTEDGKLAEETVDYFRNTDDFRKGDILLIYSITGDEVKDQETNIDPETGCLVDQSLIRYARVNNSGGTAKDTEFITSEGKPFPQFQDDNVESALLELQYEKLQYVKTIYVQDDFPTVPVIGGLYLIGSDDLNFKNTLDAPETAEKNIHPDKGDFLVYTRDKLYVDNTADDDQKVYSYAYYWKRITSGFTNADELDYYDNDRAQKLATFINDLKIGKGKKNATFSEKHIDDFEAASHTVQSALDFLMSNKAMLDEHGKVPLSQLHDTVIGAMQYRGTWKPYLLTDEQLTDPAHVEELEDGTKHKLVNIEEYHKLPGFERYEDGLLDPDARDDVTEVQNGDYYIVDSSTIVFNLLYPTAKEHVQDWWELNAGDWIVFNGPGNIDQSGEIKPETEGYWSVIDNSDRLQALLFNVDRTTDGEFWTDPLAEINPETLVGTPKFKASHKIGLVKSAPGEIEIVGDHLINQKSKEPSKTTYYPRYSNTTGEVENSYINDLKIEANQDDIHTPASKNKTIIHSNVEIGTPSDGSRGDPEARTLETFGDIIISPHVEVSAGTANKRIKSLATFNVLNADAVMASINVMAPDNSKTRQNEIVEDVVASGVTSITVMLPEKSSTLVGKLAGIELEGGRITKSIVEGYEESTSIEEHINTSSHDDSEDGTELKDKHLHDEIHNIVEVHSQLSAPVHNTYEIYFGKYHDTNPKTSYTSKDFDSTGALKEDIMARLTRNKYTTEANIEILLPCTSGTLLTQQNIINLFGHDDDSYLPMFSLTETLDNEHLRFNTLRRSPIRQVRNALRTRIKQTVSKDSLLEDAVKEQLADIFAPMKGGNETRENTVDPKVSDTVVENDLIAGEFNDDGTIKTPKSIYATKAFGIGDDTHAEGFIVPARTNFPEASQYEDPYTLQPTPVVDIVVDMPNESGVMLTSNSRVDGGIYNESQLIND